MARFAPQTEVLEPTEWRFWLGWLACWAGWHHGQILVSPIWQQPYRVECARCKKIYNKEVG